MGYQKTQFELLAPGGDIDSIKAAIAAGADAVYCGLDRFNARNRAANISLELLEGVLALAHAHKCKVFLTLNIMLLETELKTMLSLLQQLSTMAVDGIIVQDLGLAYLIKHYFPALERHASTQMNTHNTGQMKLLAGLGMSRVNLSRELNIDEITELAQFGHQHNMLTEVFVHGSYCIGFSGVCYFSSVRHGASGNRGRCSQPCREQFQRTAAGRDFPLNLKDNSAFADLPALAEAGVYSLKIEGRIKKSHYVYTTVDNWRRQIDHFCDDKPLLTDTSELYTVFNRDFSNGYLLGDIHRNMFIDNPRDNAVYHFSRLAHCQAPQDVAEVKRQLFDRKTAIIRRVEALTAAMPISAGRRRSLKGGAALPQIAKVACVESLVTSPRLIVLLDRRQVEMLPRQVNVDYCCQIPDALAWRLDEHIALFQTHPDLIPWFPAVMTESHFAAAAELLRATRPMRLITDNLGVAQLARELQLDWVAGPQLNLANSMALQCLQQELGACGGFASAELNESQLTRLRVPVGFDLYYSIFNPQHLMTSRQCLLAQANGCRKQRMNRGCLTRCEQDGVLRSQTGEAHIIYKSPGSYNRLYAEEHYFNLAPLQALAGRFSHLLIDLRPVPSATVSEFSAAELVTRFAAALQGDAQMLAQLSDGLQHTNCQQYQRGL